VCGRSLAAASLLRAVGQVTIAPALCWKLGEWVADAQITARGQTLGPRMRRRADQQGGYRIRGAERRL